MSVEQQMHSGRVRAGIDWASADHAVSVVDDHGVEVDRFMVEHRAGDLRRLTSRLRRGGVDEVAIERPDGPVVDALLDAGLTVFVIAPNQVKNLRSRLAQRAIRTTASTRSCSPTRYALIAGGCGR
jgi:hypothetical protein